ncbi:hypothetical protein [Acinetobacter lwoffii]|jgi:hypothetical protein|uniref:hypothetical protein n=1 Tax=Acinetobacter lwoffii TaxID=28090 RepID=UPI000A11E6B9
MMEHEQQIDHYINQGGQFLNAVRGHFYTADNTTTSATRSTMPENAFDRSAQDNAENSVGDNAPTERSFKSFKTE